MASQQTDPEEFQIKNLPGKQIAIVTGGAGGIGLEFSKVLASQGWSLLLIDLNEKLLDKAKEYLETNYSAQAEPLSVDTLHLDLTSADLITKIESYCLTEGLDPLLLVNNAGIFSFAPIVDTSVKKVETFVDLHVRCVTVLSQWFCSRCKEKGEGWLLNMSSMSCWMPMPGLAMYASTKSYIRVFTRSLHYELKDYGVKVMVACPGGIATDLFGLPENLKKLAVRLGVLDTPDGFARKAVKRLFKGKKQYINGLLNRFSIFFIGVTPTWVRMLVKRKLLDKGIQR